MQANAPIPVPDYEIIMKALPSALAEMTTAFNRDDYRAAHETADRIGQWYFPESEYYADRISHLLKTAFAEAYFSGMSEQIAKHAAERERSFTPPF